MTAKTKKSICLEADIAAALQTTVKNIQPRLVGLKIADICSRCGGCGHYSYNLMYGTTCFKCSGTGYQKTKLTQALLAKCQELNASGAISQYIDGMQKAAVAKKLVRDWNRKMNALWESHPVVVKEKHLRWDQASDEHCAVNHYVCGLMDSVKNDEHEIQWGIHVKPADGGRGYQRKLTYAEIIERSDRMQAVLKELEMWIESEKQRLNKGEVS